MSGWRWMGLTVTACVVLALTVVGGAGAPTAAPAPAAVQPTTTAADRSAQPRLRLALRVLAEWDRRRAHAWRSGDAAALRRLYTRGSSAADADLALLRRWQGAGWRVERLHTQVLRVRLLEASDSRLVLRLRDRLAGGAVRRGAVRQALPSSRPVTRTVTLVDVAGSWRVSRTRPG